MVTHQNYFGRLAELYIKLFFIIQGPKYVNIAVPLNVTCKVM